ncbi:MAG: response regulator transcription factor [Chloroflexi bacterium]|nr:response regulator transcription factor [Chloroflexota bacterium]
MARTESKTIKLYVVEEQEIYREVYKSALVSDISGGSFDLLGISTNADAASLREAISALDPDVVLVGTRRLRMEVVQMLEQIRCDNHRIGVVLMLVSYDAEGIKSLRRIAMKGEGGMALFLKQSLDQMEQLEGIIVAASRGQVILDPALAGSLFTDNSNHSCLRQLTARESEILNLLARGYTNAAIAETLYIDVKTVEHHINSMYGKLKTEADFDNRHPRVSAARLYLEATGELMPPVAPARTLDPVPCYR